MPVNAPPEYFKAEEKYLSAKSREEKIVALEEMIRLLPKHKSAENKLAELRGKLAKLKKESAKQKKISRKVGISKEGDAQVCLLGLTNSGKSWLLSKLTDAKPEITPHQYTTTKPEVGMIDYSGIKIQLVEIPATFDPEYMSIVRSAEAVLCLINNDEQKKEMQKILDDNFIRKNILFANTREVEPEEIKKNIWKTLNLIIVYTKKTKTPMALPKGANIKEFAQRIHKDFIKDFRFARLWRGERVLQVGLDYKLQEGDVVKLYLR